MSLLPDLNRNRYGYQGAERSGVRVTVYNHTGDPLHLVEGTGTTDFDGRYPELTPPLLQVSCSNSLSSGGQFSFTMHIPEHVDVHELVTRNAWCDISMLRFSTSWHVMRGMVDEVRVRREVTGTGVAVETATVSGRSFQKAWETTPCWFNELQAANSFGALRFDVSATGINNGNPADNVEKILFKLFDVIGAQGRANWQMPTAMPGASQALSSAVTFDKSYFASTVLQRFTPTGSLMFPDVNIWQIALQHYAEAQFCELYTDLLPTGGQLALARSPSQQQGLSVKTSHMSVIFRDKPFPKVDPACLGRIGADSIYFRLPMWTMVPQDLRATDLGISDYEAFNAFMTVGVCAQANTAAQDITKYPLWRVPDMRNNGMRRLDSNSPYQANLSAGVTDTALLQARRARLRDWYCLGGELKQGSLQMWRLWPEVHVGGRVRVRGRRPEEDLTAYIESVRHQWSPMSSSTALDVTRAFEGTDQQLLARLRRVSSSFTSPVKTV